MWKGALVVGVVCLLAIVNCAEFRVKRQFFAPVEECTVSPEEIEEIVQLTKQIEGRKVSRKRPANSGNAVEEGTDECSRLLRGLKGSIHDVLKRFGSMQKSSISQSKYEQMKAQQEQELSDMLRRVDNLERDVEQRFRAEIERLRNSLQELRRRLNENLRLLEQERLAGRRAQEALCVSYIQGGNVDLAARTYRALNGSYEAARLTNDTYQGDGDMVKALVDFFVVLREDGQRFLLIDGLEELFKQADRNNQLDRERCRIIFHSLVGLETFYTEPKDIHRVQALRVTLIDRLNAFLG